MSNSESPLISGFEGIVVGGPNQAALLKMFQADLGLPNAQMDHTAPGSNFRASTLLVGPAGNPISVVLAEPLDASVAGPKGLDSFGLWTSDLDTATARLHEFGVRKGDITISSATEYLGRRTIRATLAGDSGKPGVRFRLVERPSTPIYASSVEGLIRKDARILGIQQMALGSLDSDMLRSVFAECLGLDFIRTVKMGDENVVEHICTLRHGEFPIEFDLMEPIDPAKRGAAHKVPNNHIGFWVRDLEATVAHLTALGYPPDSKGIREGAAGHLVTFLFTLGVLIEFIQAPQDVIVSYDALAA